MEKSFGKYRVEKELGRGAMGIVYHAFDTVLERDVAIKTISSTIREEHLKERFIREARAAGKLLHPNVVTIYDFGVEDDRPFIVMEYLEGEDLYKLISEKAPIDIKEKLEIIRQICIGLDYAHQNKVYHRDIKPANIRLTMDGTVKIVDFGLAIIQTSSLTQSGSFLGTPNYTAPERLRGESASGQSDQFAVGIVLYELLTYCRAFEGETVSTVMYQVLNKEPRSLDPKMKGQFPELETIIYRAVAKGPDQRYGSMKEMADDIGVVLQKMKDTDFSMTRPIKVVADEQASVAAAESARQEPATVRTDEAQPVGRKKPWFVIAIAVAVLILVGLYLGLKGTLFGPPPANGFLVMDIKPFARILSVVNDQTGENVLEDIPETEMVTPLRLELEPGKYSITWRRPGEDDEKHVTSVAVKKGKPTIFRKPDETFIEEAITHFSVPVPGREKEENQ